MTSNPIAHRNIFSYTNNRIIEKETCPMSKRTATVYARIEPEVKKEAEGILFDLGVPVSNAINMFYKQIILNNGIPFKVVKPPKNKPLDMAKLSEEEFIEELEKGLADIEAGRVQDVKTVFENIREDYGI